MEKIAVRVSDRIKIAVRWKRWQHNGLTISSIWRESGKVSGNFKQFETLSETIPDGLPRAVLTHKPVGKFHVFRTDTTTVWPAPTSDSAVDLSHWTMAFKVIKM